MTVLWNQRDARGRLWHDASADRLRAWVRAENARFGINHDLPFKPFRSEHTGYGFPVPREFCPC